MPDSSPALALPYLLPAQAQKHVTHNEALDRLDLLVQATVMRVEAQTPPPAPAEGETHALAGGGLTGAWAGHAGQLACWRGGAWQFTAPRAGWRVWDQQARELRIWDGTAWVLPPAGHENLSGLGIGTAPDATNRLSVVAPATLLSHDGAGHRLKINKASAGDTASVLFQSGWTGHAEMGIVGDHDFSIKVSETGSAWTEALGFDAASGRAHGAAVQSGPQDGGDGKLMTVGAFGLGTDRDPPVLADFAVKDRTGFYRHDGTALSGPDPDGLAGVAIALSGAGEDQGFLVLRTDPAAPVRAWIGVRGTDGTAPVWAALPLADGDGNLELAGNRVGGQARTIADDAAAGFVPPRPGGFALVTCSGDGAGDDTVPQAAFSGMIWYETGSNTGISVNSGWTSGPGGSLAVSASDVTGTTGAPGSVTVAAQPGVLKIENRSGAARLFQVTFL